MLATTAIRILKLYQQFLSPLFPPSCRFTPSCSTYSMEAFARHGVVKATYFTLRRLTKCHPYHPGGWDPVP